MPSDHEKSCQWICVLIMHIMSNTIDQRSWEGTKTWRSKVGLFLTIKFWQFANLWILFRFSDIVCGFLFLLSNFPLQSLEYATYSSLWLISTAEELSYRVVFCCKRDSENREFYDLPRTFLHHGKKRILHAKMYQIATIN